MEGDILSHIKLTQRRTSLTYPKPLARDIFQNRSLQDFSGLIKGNMVDDVEIHRKRPSISIQGIIKPENETTQAASSESVNSENVNDEWKQVMNE